MEEITVEPETGAEFDLVTPLIYKQPPPAITCNRKIDFSDNLSSLLSQTNEFHIVLDIWYDSSSCGIISFREPVGNRAVWRGELVKTGFCTIQDDMTRMPIANIERKKISARSSYMPEEVALIRFCVDSQNGSTSTHTNDPYIRITETDEELGAFVWSIELPSKFRTISVSQLAKGRLRFFMHTGVFPEIPYPANADQVGTPHGHVGD